MSTLVTTLYPPIFRDAVGPAWVELLQCGMWDSTTILYTADELDEAIMFQQVITQKVRDMTVEMVGLPVHGRVGQGELTETVRSFLCTTELKSYTVAVMPSLSPVAAALWLVANQTGRFGRLWVGTVEGGVSFKEVDLDDFGTRAGLVKESTARYEATEKMTDDTPLKVADRLGFVGQNPVVHRAIQDAALLAQHQVPILVSGETGTGKGVMSRLIHELSQVRSGPFVAVNCAALPETLIESILFGHTKGAFTGATKDQAGKFEQAHGGTLFLDELGELPISLQPKLLKILDDGVVECLGTNNQQKVDVRLITATNRDLETAVEQGKFREDLYHRISFGLVRLPPLRERRDDIELLAVTLLDGINQQLSEPKSLSKDALAWMAEQDWPGNVRDLKNVLGRTALLTPHDLLQTEDLCCYSSQARGLEKRRHPVPHVGFSLERHLSGVRDELMQQALSLASGNQSRAARMLGISPQAVHKYVKRIEGQT